jgi:putative membrane protein insertion efficiency factor
MKSLNGQGRRSVFNIAQALRVIIWLYRHTFSAILGNQCRFMPTCSDYADQALRDHGAMRGSLLAAQRLCRCHPWGGHGYDPVPDAFSKKSGPDLIR